MLMLLAVFASPGSARITEYQEGKTNVNATATPPLVWSVKPVSGQNSWWWYLDNNLAVNAAVCYRYSINGGTDKAPNGANWASPSTNTFGTMPVAGASVCEGPYESGQKGFIGPKTLTGLTNGTVARYCAKEWFRSGQIGWQPSADPERCQTIKADTAPPTLGVDLRQGGNPVSLTNSPATMQVAISYSDSVSPPWNRGSFHGDNRLCTVTSSACSNPPNTFNFSEVCSNGTQTLSQTFSCPMGTPGADGNFFQCFAGFDGAVTDALPSNLADNTSSPATFANDDPLFFTQTFNAGTGNSAIACDSVMVDRVAPDTSITVGPAEGSTITTAIPTFSFSSTEAGSSFECRVDGGSFAPCSSPFTTAALSNGAHSFSVRATDPAGNTDASPATRNFTVAVTDTNPPDTTITAGPAEGSTISTSTPTFSFSSTEAASSFECRVDGGSFAPCSSAFTTAALSNGQHTFSVRAIDPAGNPDPSPASRSFTVNVGGGTDTTPPQTTITGKPARSTISRTGRFRFKSSEAGSTFACKLDQGAYRRCSSPFSARVKPGRHRFSVRATDPSGNADPTPATFTWRVTKPRR